MTRYFSRTDALINWIARLPQWFHVSLQIQAAALAARGLEYETVARC